MERRGKLPHMILQKTDGPRITSCIQLPDQFKGDTSALNYQNNHLTLNNVKEVTLEEHIQGQAIKFKLIIPSLIALANLNDLNLMSFELQAKTSQNIAKKFLLYIFMLCRCPSIQTAKVIFRKVNGAFICIKSWMIQATICYNWAKMWKNGTISVSHSNWNIFLKLFLQQC